MRAEKDVRAWVKRLNRLNGKVQWFEEKSGGQTGYPDCTILGIPTETKFDNRQRNGNVLPYFRLSFRPTQVRYIAIATKEERPVLILFGNSRCDCVYAYGAHNCSKACNEIIRNDSGYLRKYEQNEGDRFLRDIADFVFWPKEWRK